MNRHLLFGVALLSGWTLTQHPVVAQVVFSRVGSPSPTPPDTATVRAMPDPAGFRISYFDSTVHRQTRRPAQRPHPFSRPDSILAGEITDPEVGQVAKPGAVIHEPAGNDLRTIPSIPPVRYLTWRAFRISSQFGWRLHPLGGDARLHTGLDLPQPTGTPVYATADGIVNWVCREPDGLGLGVCIRHPTGYESIYGHLSGYSVKKGDFVRRGARIGTVGSTGRSTGPHLHYAVQYRGRPVDPARYCFLWVMAQSGQVRSVGPTASRRQAGISKRTR